MPNPSGKNGYISAPPDELIKPVIEQYVARGYSNKEIVSRLRDHYDVDKYNVSLDLLKKRRSQWGLKAARGQHHTITSIAPAIERVRVRFPNQGSHDMKQTLLQEERIMVSRELILEYMNRHHPSEVQARKTHRLKRSIFWTAGLHDLWVYDQHDKWRRFQLYLHVGLEPFSGRTLWLKIWWTNRNPRLICGWYCDTVAALGAMPLLGQSDPGTENNGVANGHTMLRHLHDPHLSQTLQHKFKNKHGNIKPEIFWSQLRKRWSPGFEDILNYGVHNGLYNPDDPLERLVFHFLFIPWLQRELDLFAERFNNSKPRHNIHKALPHGRPNDIFSRPEDFDSKDFSVKVDPALLATVREEYAPAQHPVFRLVPDEFFAQATEFMTALGNPVMDGTNAWSIYMDLLFCFRLLEDPDQIHGFSSVIEQARDEHLPVMELPPCVDDGMVGAGMHPLGSDVSSDAESDQYEFVWTTDEDSE
ncbi:hypothetical protein L210DRAFT_871640 [Boletus edulis BED1]|uniref:Integrase core domain-containing protein n=1 Tax=Boletus edulis BED1 TaxID=1328754 RepID=A0AAD4BBA4_BOLED|nr:hypothetical protein L210DRAFT_871640 [Boletus edulis BED1]